MRTVFCLGAGWLLSACTTVQVAPAPRALETEVETETSASARDGVFLGLEVAERTPTSLEDLEFLDGLEVTSVVEGSPAEAAGILRGDVLRQWDGTALVREDQWTELLASAGLDVPVRLQVERADQLHDVELRGVTRAVGILPAATQAIERWKLRAVWRTRAPDPGVELVEFSPGSPLPAAGLALGDSIVALDGVPVRSGVELAQRIHACDYGQRVTLTVDRGSESNDVHLRLWEPPSEWTEFTLWPLWTWKVSGDGAETSFSLLDFWLFSAYSYERELDTRRYSMFSLFRWATGEGDLRIEEEPSS